MLMATGRSVRLSGGGVSVFGLFSKIQWLCPTKPFFGRAWYFLEYNPGVRYGCFFSSFLFFYSF
jgi:hypothetical protein